MTEEEKQKMAKEMLDVLKKIVNDAYKSIFGINKLSYDERVILKHIDGNNYNRIGRENGMLYLKTTDPYAAAQNTDGYLFYYMYHSLFKSIKDGEEYAIADLLKE